MAYPKFTFNAYPLAFCPISTVNQADAPKSISLYPGQCVSVTSGPGIVLKGARSFGGFTFSHGAATNSQPAECVIRAFQQDGCKGSATVTGNLFDATYSGYCYDSVTGAGPPSSIAQQAEEITALSFRADCFLSTPCAA